jgi:flagellar export protein FliJ
MRSREALIRLKRFQINEQRRKVAQVEGMIAEVQRMANVLDSEVRAEEERVGIHDPAHFAYPMFAKAAMQRRENLKQSAAKFNLQLGEVKAALDEAVDDMQKLELLDEREQTQERAPQMASTLKIGIAAKGGL